MNHKTLNAQARVSPPSPARRSVRDEGAALPHEQTIAGFPLSRWERVGVRVRRCTSNMAEILEA